MKFDAKRHNLHPVLTPVNDDYPDANLDVTVSDPEVIDGCACFSIGFNVFEPSIAGMVKNGQASCKAMIYCRGTLFRDDLQSPEGEFVIQAELPMAQLMGTVEIHPFIVSTERIELARIHRRDAVGLVRRGMKGEGKGWQGVGPDGLGGALSVSATRRGF